MQPLLLWNDAYFEAELLKFLLIAGLIITGLVALVIWNAKVGAGRSQAPTPVPPTNLLDRLDWFEWLLVVVAILVMLF